MKIKKIKWYTVDLVRSNPDHCFIFGDNLIGIGKGGQAIIRDEFNAHGVPTKRTPSMDEDAFFYDEDYEENCMHILASLDSIPQDFEYLVFPEDGLGTGLAMLPQTGPKTYRFLVDEINKRFGEVYASE